METATTYLFHALYDVEEDDDTDNTDEAIAEPDEENWNLTEFCKLFMI